MTNNIANEYANYLKTNPHDPEEFKSLLEMHKNSGENDVFYC